jgi:hypothetical protein
MCNYLAARTAAAATQRCTISVYSHDVRHELINIIIIPQ